MTVSSTASPKSRPERPITRARKSPTLADLRAVVQKDRHREIGNWLARHWARPTAIYGTWLGVRIGLSAHMITIIAFTCGLMAAAAIGLGSTGGFASGVALGFLSFWLDRVDGQVARWNGTVSLDGVYLDYLMHYATNLALGFALGFGLARHDGLLAWCLAGFAIATGWTLLALHNDCRYKSFFKHVKASTHSYLIVGGAGGGPTPPLPWPASGLASISWPLYKSCEAHIILIVLGLLAVLAVVSPSLWILLWKAFVISQAILAPTLALLRIAKAIQTRSTETSFRAWFQHVEPEGVDGAEQSLVVSCAVVTDHSMSRST
jgi:CDP-alcohol phosphatidyltransferase